jgi:hypothetical protein
MLSEKTSYWHYAIFETALGKVASDGQQARWVFNVAN